jgi:hypothetical protein
MNLYEVEDVGLLIHVVRVLSVRNAVQSNRQKIRSKRNYYKSILSGTLRSVDWTPDRKGMVKCGQRTLRFSDQPHIYNVWRPKKWSYSYARHDLQRIVKSLSIELLTVELELNELTYKTTELMKDALKILGCRQRGGRGDNKVNGLVFHDGDNYTFIGMTELERFVEDVEFENIILGAEDDVLSVDEESK